MAWRNFFEPYKTYENVPDGIVLIETSKFMYAISNLVALRHFAAHGQATAKEVVKKRVFLRLF